MPGTPLERIDRNRHRRLECVCLAFCLGSALLYLVVHLLTTPLDSLQDIEAQLERPILAFAVWEGTTYIVVEYGGSVHFDRLVLDPVSLEWPPLSRWQWSGNWSSLPVTDAAASVARSSHPIPQVLFGQVNDESIVTMEVNANGAVQRFTVAAPGFLVRYEGVLPPSTEVTWLDAAGRVVWTAEVLNG
jgi:hypothetical protein